MTRRMMHWTCSFAVLISAVAAMLVAGVGPASAVIGGGADAGRHPYVGAVDGRPVGGPVRFGSGVLISPTVFLTVGHGTARFEAAGFTRARVTFDEIVTDSSTWYEGTIHTNPTYDPNGKGQRGDFGDLGVIVFDAPIPGVTPASLPPEHYLEHLADRARFEIPGYGISKYVGGANGGGKRIGDYNSGGVRTVADEVYASLSPGWLRLRPAGSATICTGDSGSPSVLSGTNLVTGVTAVEWSLAGGECQSTPWEQRVDTPLARAFLSQYVLLP